MSKKEQVSGEGLEHVNESRQVAGQGSPLRPAGTCWSPVLGANRITSFTLVLVRVSKFFLYALNPFSRLISFNFSSQPLLFSLRRAFSIGEFIC